MRSKTPARTSSNRSRRRRSPGNSKMKRAGRALVALAIIAAAAVPIRADDVDNWVRAQINARRVPAVSIAVIKGGLLVKAEGYGIANLEHNIPATPGTVYKSGSVSKQFIAAGV